MRNLELISCCGLVVSVLAAGGLIGAAKGNCSQVDCAELTCWWDQNAFLAYMTDPNDWVAFDDPYAPSSDGSSMDYCDPDVCDPVKVYYVDTYTDLCTNQLGATIFAKSNCTANSSLGQIDYAYSWCDP